jgi:hypothetical protein
MRRPGLLNFNFLRGYCGMPGLPENEYRGAMNILSKYYKHAMKCAAEEIIERKEEFDSVEDEFGGASNVIDKHYSRLYRISCVYGWLRSYSTDLPRGSANLGKDEFRCFSCGGVIRREDTECRLCGWTWKKI